MTTVNGEYLKLPGSYLFSEIARRVAAFTEKNPERILAGGERQTEGKTGEIGRVTGNTSQ